MIKKHKKHYKEWQAKYLEGMSIGQIADEYGTSDFIVYYHLKRLGITFRSKWQTRKEKAQAIKDFILSTPDLSPFALSLKFNLTEKQALHYLFKNLNLKE